MIVRALSIGLLATALFAQAPAPKLTLQQAKEISMKTHPRVSGAVYTAQAAQQVVAETRSAYFPNVFGSVTGAGAADGSRLGAGNLNNPIIYNRFATGFTVGQLITDFGRTSNLVRSAEFQARSEEQNTQATRASVLLEVSRSYYRALRAQNVLGVAEQTVKARQLVTDQVTALANSKLKSGLDVSFANVNLSEAKLMLLSAQNEVQAAFSDLSSALGYQQRQVFDLAEEPMPAPPPPVDALIRQAMGDRPELAALRLEESAAQSRVRAERALLFPSVGLLVSAGVIPGRDEALRGRYGAAGINVNIPVFNGNLYGARRAEAELRARAAGQNSRDLEIRIARDVEVAWLNANTAFQRLSLTAQMLDQARQALDLAQSRYDLGLSSIVELSQAQLNSTTAEIASTSARYDYQIQRALLDYQTGALR